MKPANRKNKLARTRLESQIEATDEPRLEFGEIMNQENIQLKR